MPNGHGKLAAQDLVVTEIDQPYEVTEEDLTLVAIACTCTTSINFSETPTGDSSVAFDEAMDVETSIDLGTPVAA